MTTIRLDVNETIFVMTERYPELIPVLVSMGFAQLGSETLRKTLGRTITLKQALNSKKLSEELAVHKLEEALARKSTDITAGLVAAKQTEGDVRVAGVLPCPIRVPLLTKFTDWVTAYEQQSGKQIAYDLQAASMGLDDIKSGIKAADGKADDLAEVYLSAGFDLFFDKNLLGAHRDAGVFQDLSGLERLNKDFDNEDICLRDPLGQYSVIGVVAAIFSVDTEALGERKFPTSWADLLSEEFLNTISLPMRDLDLFNAVLLNIYKNFGTEGLVRLGRNLYDSRHPAQMVKAGRVRRTDGQGPVINVMPYFFTQMLPEDGPVKPVWPREGALVSPIFLLTKAGAKEAVQPIVDFFFSEEIGNLMAAGGKFPSTVPGVDNHLTAEQKFCWVGWDFIHNHDIGELLSRTEKIFLGAAGRKEKS